MRIGFIGLGVMGAPVAAHLAKSGHLLTVHNRSRRKTERWLAANPGRAAKTPAEAADGAEAVILFVGDDADVERVLFGQDGVTEAAKPSAIVIDHTTTSAEIAERAAKTLRAKGLHFLDAPVSGGQSGAENGELAIMVGGDERTFRRVKPLMGHYGARIALLGKNGSGQRAKMVNQICAAGVIQGLSEGLAFAEKSGIDLKRALAVICRGAAASWQMQNRAATMLERRFDFGFAIDWMRKDLQICLKEAGRLKIPLTAAAQAKKLYDRLSKEMGMGRADTSALICAIGGAPNKKRQPQ